MFVHLRINDNVSKESKHLLKEMDLIETFKTTHFGLESCDSFWVNKGAIVTPGGGKIFNSIEDWRHR